MKNMRFVVQLFEHSSSSTRGSGELPLTSANNR